MLIAQALGEYVAVSAMVDAFNTASIQLEETVGEWGTEGVVLLLVGAVFWMLIMRRR